VSQDIQQSSTSTVSPLRVAVLVSGSGSNLQALIDAIESGQLLHTKIVLVVSNRADAAGLQRALKHKIPAMYLPWAKRREESEAKLQALLALFQVDLIVLAGFMKIFNAEFIMRYPERIINLHPALLPDDGGSTYITSDSTVIPAFRGAHVVRDALQAGVKVTGASVHYVIPEVDAGPVICREEMRIEEGDTEETLHERIKAVEHRLIVEAVKAYRKPR
jgi:phosphoribosylglycinamide formyltransferase-1